ncbi:LytTR family transcriptional regulator [Pseudoflavitalea sp. G-6-1-2]|uniref:LytR/AlgR family response regulator transcription factor n=1 Tax=Pseudoflavitalea sp. G-6-1-2 TaxID=2728841 RepID=UPI00146EB25C|nr:LytTR family DNA-binding domain-containing protein [Pseudoflavitalea sp. G-6-1-2]NML21155.1 LytTR family transcriptional regulator [Pseudoflavitalea sp. G-6-1-2]
MKVVIIEEEEKIASRLRMDLLQSTARAESIDHFTDFFEFVQYIKGHGEPDLLLVNILQLNNKAMRYLREGHLNSPLLFTNCYKEAGSSKGYAQDTVPAKFLQVQHAWHALCTPQSGNLLTATASAARTQYQPRFLVKQRDKLASILTSDIAIFYSEGRLSFFKTRQNKKYILQHSIETLSAELLDPEKFFRVNRAIIVSFDAIKEMYAYFGGRIKLVLDTPYEKEIIVSRDKVAAFKRWLGE